MDLHFRKLGAGQPMIILHGLFGSSDNWLTISKEFATKYEVFLVDQRNHGHSPHDAVHTYEAMALDLKKFIESNNIENPIIVGHSMGGKTAMKFAQLFGHNIHKLIIVDISPKYYVPHHNKEITALESINLSELKSRQQADDLMLQYINDIGVRQFLLKNLYRTTEGIFQWRMNLPVLVKSLENIMASADKFVSDVETLFIKGQKSDYILDEDTEIISRIFPKFKIKTIQNAGHWVQAEQPVLFVEAVNEFLNS